MSIVRIPEQWRQTIATLIVNLLSVHLGIGLVDFAIANDFNRLSLKSVAQQFREAVNESDIKNVHDEDAGSTNVTIYMITMNLPVTLQINNPNTRLYAIDVHYMALWLGILIVYMIPLSDQVGRPFGRKGAMTVSAILFVIANLSDVAVFGDTSTYVIFIGAVISTLARTVACTIQFSQVPSYVFEISSERRRGPHSIIYVLLVVIGLYFGFFKHELLKTFSATILDVLAPLLLLVGLQILPESPRWLWNNKRFSAAERAEEWLQIDDEPEGMFTISEWIEIVPESSRWVWNNKEFSAAERAEEWLQIDDEPEDKFTISEWIAIVPVQLLRSLVLFYIIVTQCRIVWQIWPVYLPFNWYESLIIGVSAVIMSRFTYEWALNIDEESICETFPYI